MLAMIRWVGARNDQVGGGRVGRAGLRLSREWPGDGLAGMTTFQLEMSSILNSYCQGRGMAAGAKALQREGIAALRSQ